MASYADLKGELGKVKKALAFLNLTALNNPHMSADELRKRPDVEEALTIVQMWLDVIDQVASQFPPFMKEDKKAVRGTVKKMRTELFAEYAWTNPKATDNLVVRMHWLLEWLIWPFTLMLALLDGKYTKKTWNSRLTPRTCQHCRALHGTTLLLTDSFAAVARGAGWDRVYGSLMGPPLHPSCQCYLTFL